MVPPRAPPDHQAYAIRACGGDGMSERKREIKEKLYLGALVVLVAMIAWVLVINIWSRH
jgi:hypothetical protein